MKLVLKIFVIASIFFTCYPILAQTESGGGRPLLSSDLCTKDTQCQAGFLCLRNTCVPRTPQTLVARAQELVAELQTIISELTGGETPPPE